MWIRGCAAQHVVYLLEYWLHCLALLDYDSWVWIELGLFLVHKFYTTWGLSWTSRTARANHFALYTLLWFPLFLRFNLQPIVLASSLLITFFITVDFPAYFCSDGALSVEANFVCSGVVTCYEGSGEGVREVVIVSLRFFSVTIICSIQLAPMLQETI